MTLLNVSVPTFDFLVEYICFGMLPYDGYLFDSMSLWEGSFGEANRKHGRISLYLPGAIGITLTWDARTMYWSVSYYTAIWWVYISEGGGIIMFDLSESSYNITLCKESPLAWREIFLMDYIPAHITVVLLDNLSNYSFYLFVYHVDLNK